MDDQLQPLYDLTDHFTERSSKRPELLTGPNCCAMGSGRQLNFVMLNAVGIFEVEDRGSRTLIGGEGGKRPEDLFDRQQNQPVEPQSQ